MRSAKLYSLTISVAIFGLLIARFSDAAIYKYLIPHTLDDGFIARDSQFFQQMPYLFLGIFLCLGIGEFMSRYCMGYVARSVVRDYRQQMLKHLLQVPVEYYKKITSGELLSKINYDSEQVAVAVSDAIREFLNSIVAICILISVMFSISWRVSSVILLAVPVIAWVMKYAGRKMRRYSARVQKTMGNLTNVSSEIVNGYQEIKVFQGEEYEKIRIEQATNENRKQELRTFLVTALSSPIMQLLGGLVLISFVFMVTRDKVTLSTGQIVGLIGAMFALIRPLKQITEVNNVFQKGIAAVESIQSLLDIDKEKNTGTKTIENSRGHIKFDNVNFSYANNSNIVINNLSLEINSGETIALVGKSGSGKSTLMNLLLRFYVPTSGTICLDNIDISELELTEYRRQLALVSQNVILFNDTIANNIAYGHKVDKDKILSAAEAANCLEFIDNLPNGFDTFIGENGCLLSGGQRQRIAIARALLKDAPVLLLDEATSALDNQSEDLIKQALDNLTKNRTTLIIAHRLSSIEKADKIYQLHNGNLELVTYEKLSGELV